MQQCAPRNIKRDAGNKHHMGATVYAQPQTLMNPVKSKENETLTRTHAELKAVSQRTHFGTTMLSQLNASK